MAPLRRGQVVRPLPGARRRDMTDAGADHTASVGALVSADCNVHHESRMYS